MSDKERKPTLGAAKPTRRKVLKGIGYTVIATATCSVVSLSTFGCSDSTSPAEPVGGGYGYY
ncbi:MAG: hypothetical protein GY838_02270 [bacterium]|nr:hypothetical protein [bacterium]